MITARMASERGKEYPRVWFATKQKTKICVAYSKHTALLELVRDSLQRFEFGFGRFVLRRFSPLILDNSFHRRLPDFASRASSRFFLNHQPRFFPSHDLPSLRPKPNTLYVGAAVA